MEIFNKRYMNSLTNALGFELSNNLWETETIEPNQLRNSKNVRELYQILWRYNLHDEFVYKY